MALSGSITTNASENRSVTLNWTATQDTTNNRSTVNWSLVGSGSFEGWVTSGPFTVTINGVSKSSSGRINVYQGTTVLSGSTVINHNNDGSKTFSASVSGAIYYGTTNVSASGTFTLNQIPRQSSISSTSGTMLGSEVTVNVSRVLSNYTHNMDYSFAGSSWTRFATGVATSGSFTPPVSLASRIPNATTGTLQVRVMTMNGSTQVGSTVTKTWNLSVPSSVVPTVSEVNVSEAVSTVATNIGEYVQNQSKLRVAITAAGTYGSTIKTYTTTISGVSYSGQTITSNTITTSGSLTITSKVTDSRGRSASRSQTISVLGYQAAKVNTFDVIRSDAGGTENPTGTNAKITYNTSIYALNSKNTRSTVIRYRPANSTTWTTVLNDTTNWNLNTNRVISGVSESTSYIFEITVRDRFGSATREVMIGSGFFALTWLTDGTKGVALGKVAERPGIDFSEAPMVNGKPTIFFGTVEDI